MNISDIYKSKNYGDFQIVEMLENHEVKVRFLGTGYECVTQVVHAKCGNVRDRFCPTIFGFGYAGVGRHKQSNGGVSTKAYKTWYDMLRRCYSERFHQRRPSYRGCSVCSEWHNFQNFADWYERNHVEGYELDKDIKIKGNKTYSPEACMFVSAFENSEAANAKHFVLTSPEGEVFEVFNLSRFCRNNSLSQSSMSLVCNGWKDSYKGWTGFVGE